MLNQEACIEEIERICRREYNVAQVRRELANMLQVKLEEILVVGPLHSRVVLVRDRTRAEFLAISIDRPLEDTPFYEKHRAGLSLHTQNVQPSKITLTDSTIELLETPKIKMVALYHPEHFPLPRFPLGISDIAAAVRNNVLGQISLSDMQLGKDVDDILSEIAQERPDVVGISATFGQQDKLEELMEMIEKIDNYSPLIVFGGSLSALNAKHLLEKYSGCIVSMGYGETTMKDIVEYWHKMRGKHTINNVTYLDDNQAIVRTPIHTDDKKQLMAPELDLLEETLTNRGAMQLESSRGCTYSCSFCPRGHKGLWSGSQSDFLESTIGAIESVFEKHPDIARKIFLVDEEFLGYNANDDIVLDRAKAVAIALKTRGFHFESSTRMDQVYKTNRSPDWHAKRITFWREIVDSGLEKMLFGMESGVDSILKRFNKQTTSDQNILGVRTLTSCGVPLRLTYITFDPLMTMDELIETYKFQGRDDILLEVNAKLSPKELHEAVNDVNYVTEHSQRQPLYREIPYMLVSMECLLNSPYLEKVEKFSLAGEANFNMGKKNADYLEPTIGLMSTASQMWIDRNFALDYLLKSLIKIAPSRDRGYLNQLRWILKDFAYELLGMMLSITNERSDLTPKNCPLDLKPFQEKWLECQDFIQQRAVIIEVMDCHFDRLRKKFMETLDGLRPHLRHEDATHIFETINTWAQEKNWKLINS